MKILLQIAKSTSGTTITVKKCPDWEKCNTQGTCEKEESGFYCLNGTQCSSGNCTNNTCIGKEEISSCSSDIECNVGLYCNSDKCEPLIGVGKECQRDSQCVSNAFCNKNICIEYLTLENGELSDNAMKCKSFFIADI